MPDTSKDQKICEYIKRTGSLVAQAEKQAAAQVQKTAAVNALIPDVVDALISNGRIAEELREKAAAQLKDHARTLEILASVAAHRNDVEKMHIGTGVKSASAAKRGFAVGERTSEEKESDVLMLERFGIRAK